MGTYHCFFSGHYVIGNPVTRIFSKFRWKSGHVVTRFFLLEKFIKKVMFLELGGIEKKERQFEKAILFCLNASTYELLTELSWIFCYVPYIFTLYICIFFRSLFDQKLGDRFLIFFLKELLWRILFGATSD